MTPTETAIKILITEDEILIAREIEMVLQDLGYTVAAIASDGITALAKIAETQPDLVLMDIVIQGEQDGIETAQAIHDQFQLPVIFLTAYADVATLQRAKITEPFGYVLKPFQPQELNIAIQVALVRHRTEQMRLQTLRNNISLSLPHEINTPLHGIVGFTDLLLRYYDSMSRTEMLETLQCMQNSVLSLERVCQNFLLYAKLEVLSSYPHPLKLLHNNVTYATHEVIENCAEKQARQFNRATDLKLELDHLDVQMTEVYFRKLVEELINNAFKFSEPRSRVTVRSTVHGQTFYLTISDRGVGMSTEQVASIGAYMQFDRPQFAQPGIGLGLALCQRLAVLHGGSLSMQSIIHEGTTIVVQLPLLQADADMAEFDPAWHQA